MLKIQQFSNEMPIEIAKIFLKCGRPHLTKYPLPPTSANVRFGQTPPSPLDADVLYGRPLNDVITRRD